MTARFADTGYFIALVNADDESHRAAVGVTRSYSGGIVTTSAVLNELANYLAHPPNRPLFLETLARLRQNPMAQIVFVDGELFEEGVRLFEARADKEWSLTDCISFVVMDRMRLREALTPDHHFEQAGFNAMLKQ